MIHAPATHYKQFTSNLTPTVIEGGKPIIVHNIIFSNVNQNANLAVYEADGVTPIMILYVDNAFGACPTSDLHAPFLAPRGISIFSYVTFLTDTTADVKVTIFYSHIGG